MKNKKLVGATLFCAFSITFIMCKKNSKELFDSSIISNESAQAARLSSVISGVSYNSDLNTLEFSTIQSYTHAVESLSDQFDALSLDNGRTSELLLSIATSSNTSNLTDTLLYHSPLSDTVLATLIRSSFPEDKFLSVMSKNWSMSDKISAMVFDENLSSSVLSGRLTAARNRTPYLPVISDFEDQFSSFISHRKDRARAEINFINSGGELESAENPAKELEYSTIESSLYNADLEVVIEDKFIKKLPNYQVSVSKSNSDAISYIREHGKIPMTLPTGTEPTNGYDKSSVSLPISSDIQVFGTSSNSFADNELYIQATRVSGREIKYTFSNITSDPSYQYFWDFGDGKVSFSSNPTHVFGHNAAINVQMTVIRPDGLFETRDFNGTFNGPFNSTTDCKVTHLLNSVQSGTTHAAMAWIDLDDPSMGYPGTYTITLDLDWGDGSSSTMSVNSINTYAFNHTYSSYGTYTIKSKVKVQLTASKFDCDGALSTILQVVNPNVCCDKRDKDKEWWFIANQGWRRYKHMFKVRNYLFQGGKLDTEIHLWRKVRIGNEYTYLPANETGCLSITGNCYPSFSGGDAGSKCEGTTQSVELYNNNAPGGCVSIWAFQNLSYQAMFGTKIYLSNNQCWSTATCWSVSHQIFLTDDCNQ